MAMRLVSRMPTAPPYLTPITSGPTCGDLLPLGLREACDLLARGLLRLRSRAAEEAARDAADRGERLLHFPAAQRLHANPTTRRDA